MEYKLLTNSKTIRSLFIAQFVESFEEFSEHHQEFISRLRTAFNREYYDKMFMWDRIWKNVRQISFADALDILKKKEQPVLFLTESPQVEVREYCKLNNQCEFVAQAEASDLAECISYEWFAEYKLLAQNCSLADPILPSDLYVFDDSYTWCLIFTHETDDWDNWENADARVCFLIDKNIPHSSNH